MDDIRASDGFRQLPCGLQQDHLGRNFYLEVNGRGEQRQVFVDEPALSAKTADALTRITAVSLSRLNPDHEFLGFDAYDPKQPAIRRKLETGSLHREGQVYMTLKCLQGNKE